MLSIGNAFFSLKASLVPLYEEGESLAIAHMVLDDITGMTRMQRLSVKDDILTDEQEATFNGIAEQLALGIPVQYALGYTYFLGQRFEVSNAVLIPRPETEELVSWILEEASPSASIIDIGTGSGCIPISLKSVLARSTVSAVDISSAALAVAKQNAVNLNADIQFKELDFLDQATWTTLSTYDIIVSNPPYIPLAESHTLHSNVRDHEPGTALFVPSDDALLFYRSLAQFGKDHLAPNGSIYCELHQDYAEHTASLFKDLGYANVTLRKDINGLLRMLRASSTNPQ